MIDTAVKDQILRDLDRLSPQLQRRAQEFVHTLVETLLGPTPRGASVNDLLPLSGILDEDSAGEMRAVIDEYCERIDDHDWR